MVARRIMGTGGGGKISPEVEDTAGGGGGKISPELEGTAGGSYCLISLRMESNFVSAPFASNLFEGTFTSSGEESSWRNWEETSKSWKSEGGRGVTRPRGFDPRMFGEKSDSFEGAGLGITRLLGLSFRVFGDTSEDFVLGMSFDDFLEFLLTFIFKLDFLL